MRSCSACLTARRKDWLPNWTPQAQSGAFWTSPVITVMPRGWTYGMAEWGTSKLQSAKRVAVPGCFATAISMACAPFVASGRVCGPVRTVAATGSTGLGAKASSAGHHPERFVNMKAYKVLSHQHGPEITTFLRGVGAFEELQICPWSAPLDRGILATSFIPDESSVCSGGERAFGGGLS